MGRLQCTTRVECNNTLPLQQSLHILYGMNSMTVLSKFIHMMYVEA